MNTPPSIGPYGGQSQAAGRPSPWRRALIAACVLAVLGMALWAAWVNVATGHLKPAALTPQEPPKFDTPTHFFARFRA
ncbi:MAG: hypothetical protein U5L74_07580 [Ideonella sp.]|nr:hypothetical protein [Ideonella sp.]